MRDCKKMQKPIFPFALQSKKKISEENSIEQYTKNTFDEQFQYPIFTSPTACLQASTITRISSLCKLDKGTMII